MDYMYTLYFKNYIAHVFNVTSKLKHTSININF